MNPLFGISDWVWGFAGVLAIVCLAAEAVQGNLW